jgi:hypothetical protein
MIYTTVSVAQAIYRRMAGWLANNELELGNKWHLPGVPEKIQE